MLKNRKDSGFTLIELMIVIAVIGILAIVLVPKVGTVKTQAKESGLDVNVRLVQGYAESKINKWVSNPNVELTDVIADIDSAFTGNNKALTNPITSQTLDAVTGNGTNAPAPADQPLYILDTFAGTALATDTDLSGTILVAVEGTVNAGKDTITSVNIFAYDENGVQITEKAVTVTP